MASNRNWFPTGMSGSVLLGLGLAFVVNSLTPGNAAGGTPPVVYPLKWYRPTGACDSTTDTPAALAYTRAISRTVGGGSEAGAIASPAEGTEAAPGVFLNLTAAAQDRSSLRFTFLRGTDVLGVVDGVLPDARRDKTFQTAKLSVAVLPDAAVHSIKVRVHRISSPDDAVETAPVSVQDPREELRQELAGLGFGSVSAFQESLAPVVERTQADFRIHGWGTSGETGFYAAAPPTYYSYSGFGVGTGATPLFLDGRAGLPNPAPDLSGVLLRRQAWVENDPTVALPAADEATGEYFVALLNAEAGFLGLNATADLVRAPQALPSAAALPEIYRRTSGGPGCFPRQSENDFLLPDLLYFENTLELLKQAPFQRFGVLASPQTGVASYQDLADAGRIFNDQTSNLVKPATGVTGDLSIGARHQPQTPRVRLFRSITDGSSRPVICWSFFDPHCDHVQTGARVWIDAPTTGAPTHVVAGAAARSLVLTAGLTPGVHVISVQVLDNSSQLGFPADLASPIRTIQVIVP